MLATAKWWVVQKAHQGKHDFSSSALSRQSLIYLITMFNGINFFVLYKCCLIRLYLASRYKKGCGFESSKFLTGPSQGLEIRGGS